MRADSSIPVERVSDLENGPLSGIATRVVEAAHSLVPTRVAAAARAAAVPYMFDLMERSFAAGEDPVAAVRGGLGRLEAFFRSVSDAGLEALGPSEASPNLSVDADGVQSDVARSTGRHYGRLFEAFDAESFWEEPRRLLAQRLERNDLELENLGRKRVLDDGCGGGRYTVAWKLLGAGKVVGIDVSSVGLRDARQRIEEAGIDGVDFTRGSVLELPYGDESFDVVFSNGVLHHTEDWRRGIVELVRVLRPGGFGWLYLIERPGGVFWETIDVLRLMMKNVNRGIARESLKFMGIPANRIFYMLDHVMVPINLRLEPSTIEDALRDAGASGIRRLRRGTDFDRIEQIHREVPYAVEMYGVGENRFVFSKS